MIIAGIVPFHQLNIRVIPLPRRRIIKIDLLPSVSALLPLHLALLLLRLELLLGLLLLALESLLLLARQAGEFAIGATEDEARVEHVEEDEAEENGKAVEAEDVVFALKDGVIIVGAGDEFDEAEDDSDLSGLMLEAKSSA